MLSRNALIRVLSISAVLALPALEGCRGYSYTLNERTVYEPPKLFRDYAISDDHLRACVAQAIDDQRITQPEALLDLNCSNAGISSLAGIEVFTQLRRLGLDDNNIADLTPLYALTHLELLHLRNNSVRNISTQFCQGASKQLALAGNSAADCALLSAVTACGVKLIDAPAHCQ